MSGRSSGVEHDLAKVGVEGSNPFARSIFQTATVRSALFPSGNPLAEIDALRRFQGTREYEGIAMRDGPISKDVAVA